MSNASLLDRVVVHVSILGSLGIGSLIKRVRTRTPDTEAHDMNQQYERKSARAWVVALESAA